MNTLIPVEHEGQRVLFTKQLAEAYETTTQVISNNFNNNKERYIEGKHYFVLEGEAKREFLNLGQIVSGSNPNRFDVGSQEAATSNLTEVLNRHKIYDGSNLTQNDFGSRWEQLVTVSKKATKLYLWTEKGALMHAKSLNTDRAWEVYDRLVETYFRAKQALTDASQLSPQLQLLINLELEQKRQAAALHVVEQKVDSLRDVVSMDSQSWRVDCRNMLTQIAKALGGGEAYREVYQECFALVDQRGGVSLERRLTNKFRRMLSDGVCKSRCDKLTKIDVIAEDKKLIEIYLAVVKEMAIKYGVITSKAC